MSQTLLRLESIHLIQERMDFLVKHFWSGVEHEGSEVSPELRQAIAELKEFLLQLKANVSEQETYLSRQNERLAVLAALSLLDKDLPSLLNQVVEVTTELLPAKGGSSVTLWDVGREEFQLTATTVPGQTPELARARIRKQGGATRWIMDNKRARIVPDVSKDVYGDAVMLKEFALKAFVGVPLLVANEVLGVLYAFDKEPRDYSQEDVHFMTIVAGRAAHAIYLTRLLERTQHALSSSQALQRVSRGLILPADALTDAGFSELQAVVDNIVQAVAARRVLLLTFNVEAKQVTRFIVGGRGASDVPPEPFENYEQGLTGWVLREKKATLSPKTSPDPRESPFIQEQRKGRRVGSIVIAPVMFGGQIYGTLTASRDVDEEEFTPRDLKTIEELAAQAAITLRNSDLYEETKYFATVDDLTGCLNRRHLFELGERELKRHRRLRHSLSALMFDLDHFKHVNDSHGHAVGDEVLRILAERASLHTREIDILGRYGGEEFALLLPETQLSEALEIAERLRLAALASINVEGLELRVSISVGVAQAQGDPSVSHLLQRADAALYQAKRKGRNCVVALPDNPN
jgi:diguanylate cyclase (GGDEF)-like protein